MGRGQAGDEGGGGDELGRESGVVGRRSRDELGREAALSWAGRRR